MQSYENLSLLQIVKECQDRRINLDLISYVENIQEFLYKQFPQEIVEQIIESLDDKEKYVELLYQDDFENSLDNDDYILRECFY